jgi:hypothetical protein
MKGKRVGTSACSLSMAAPRDTPAKCSMANTGKAVIEALPLKRWKRGEVTVLADQSLLDDGNTHAHEAAGHGVGAALGQVARFSSEVEFAFVSPP